jgi:ADP-ribosylglycohydrolase
LTLAGLLFPGQPEQAYRAAFQADFYDIGYAREAAGLLAASISLAIAQEMEPKELLDRVIELDPLHLGGEFGEPFVIGHLPALYPIVADARSDREAARALSAALRYYHPFDAFKALAIALLATVVAAGDPLRAILIAANHVGMDEDGRPTRYEDVDCYASIAGAIAGAMVGAEAFPADLLRQVIESNKAVHGFDLNRAVDRFSARCLP